MRNCDGCTKCCEGWLSGNINGRSMYRGRPCHYVSIGRGCSIYKDRPKDPCIDFKCQWLIDEEIPEWMKPSHINTIVRRLFIGEHEYCSLVEAGDKLPVEVLSWFVMEFAVKRQINLHYKINNEDNFIGSDGFVSAMRDRSKNTQTQQE